jgi:N-acetylneuraminic acid mutarotase
VAKALGKIYAIGGITGSNLDNITYVYANEEYDPATNKWITKAPLPLDVMAPNSVIGNQFLTGAAVNDKIYISGGNAGENIPTFVYDPATDTWSKELAPLGKFVNEPYSSTSSGGDIYVNYGSTFIKYITSEDEWRLLEPPSTPRFGVALASSPDMIYGLGGYSYGSNNYTIHKSVDRYNINNGTWSIFSYLKFPRHSSAALLLGNKLYLAGGAKRENYIDIPLADFEVLTIK